jgi:hypothetical protein
VLQGPEGYNGGFRGGRVFTSKKSEDFFFSSRFDNLSDVGESPTGEDFEESLWILLVLRVLMNLSESAGIFDLESDFTSKNTITGIVEKIFRIS